MQHWYAELFFFVLMVFVPTAIVFQCGWSKVLTPNHRLMIIGCGMLAISTSLDFAAHALMQTVSHNSTADMVLMLVGFIPGTILVVVGVLRWIRLTSDLTDEVRRRKDAEQKLLRITDKLEAAAKEAEKANQGKSDFLANMSHELRTPLNAIIGFTELMDAELFGKLGSPEYKDYVGIVHDSGQHLLDIIGDLLDLNKIQSGQMKLREESINLQHLMEQCAALKQEAAQKKSIATTVKADQRINLLGDVRMIRQVIISLLGNALGHCANGGEIGLSVQASSKGQIIITVRDNGGGMTTAEIERATMPFGHGDSLITRSHERAALSLSLVNTFVELHEGRLMIDAVRGVGTTVTLTFPAHRVLSAINPETAQPRKAVHQQVNDLSGVNA